MNTTRNRSKVLAQALRAALHELAVARRNGPGAEFQRTNALLSIGEVAVELEAVAAGRDLPVLPPDPAGGAPA